jgi:hypothetical protein
VAASYELRRHCTVSIQTFGLEIRSVRTADVRPFVPVEPQPTQTVDNSRDHLPRGSFGICVLDAQDEGATMAARV